MYGTDEVTAHKLAAIANEENLQPLEGKRVVRFVVRPHAWIEGTRIPRKWGVWPTWEYTDRPDLGPQFGGPFMVLADIAPSA